MVVLKGQEWQEYIRFRSTIVCITGTTAGALFVASCLGFESIDFLPLLNLGLLATTGCMALVVFDGLPTRDFLVREIREHISSGTQTDVANQWWHKHRHTSSVVAAVAY